MPVVDEDFCAFYHASYEAPEAWVRMVALRAVWKGARRLRTTALRRPDQGRRGVPEPGRDQLPPELRTAAQQRR
jgi:hypothetical protein